MIRLDHDKRARIAAAKAEIATIMDPVKAKERKERRARDREARKRVGKRVEGQRQPRERDPGFLAFLRRQPCCVAHLGNCGGRTDPAHIRFTDRSVGRVNPGLSRKSDDKWCLPVCRSHHDQQHAYGNEAKWWSDVVKADPNELAVSFHEKYQGSGQ